MATISNTPRPGYVYDSADAVWYPIGTGTHSHNEIASTIVDAKGDIIAATAADTPARLAVGANGDTLVADSATATGLRYKEDYAAGKNKIINGDFNINQRAFTSNTTNNSYNFDRFLQANSGGTTTVTPQTFTAGAAPVAGYEAKNFVRIVTASQSAAGDYALYGQKIEDVRTLAGQTATISFWAKASTGTPKIGATLDQYFGTGGAASSTVTTSAATQTITTAWVRYSFTISVPSISGKTIGTDNNSSLSLYIATSVGTTLVAAGYPNTGIQNITVDIWGVQVEESSVATAFQTATGTIQGELAACQRYYWRSVTGNAYARHPGSGAFASATTGYFALNNPIQLRISAPSVDFSNLTTYDFGTNRAVTNITLSTDQQTPNCTSLTISIASGGTQYRPFQLTNDNNANGYIGISAEL